MGTQHCLINFLSELAASGLEYRTVNNFRSAISAEHFPIEGKPVDEHPLVCKLMKGIRMSNPPRPKYTTIWGVNVVLKFFEQWPANRYLSRKQLFAKLTMLLCLISCKRVSDVQALDLAGRVFSPEGVSFTITCRTKSIFRLVTYSSLPDNSQLYVVQCLNVL